MTIRVILLGIAMVCSVLTFAQTDTLLKDTSELAIPVISMGSDLLETEDQTQDISGLLQSSRDAYTSAAGFNFSAARFQFRGYSSENTVIQMGGIPMNDPETGWAIWSFWGGLNDVTRYPELKMGVANSRRGFGGVGGISYIDLNASSQRAGTRVSYAATNRTYTDRVMISHNTGWKKGWALATSFSRRWSKEGYVEGTYFDGISYFLAVEKKLNEKHSINLAAFGAPTVQARQGIAVQEAYDLTGNNYYNPYWGYQTDGSGNQVKRNSRIRNNHKPFFVLTEKLKLNDKTSIENNLYFITGRTGNSNLNWYDAADPRPDYYKKLPSYYTLKNDSEGAQTATNNWQSDANTQQINWDQLYFANSKNLYEVQNANGGTAAISGNRAKYIVEEYRIDPRQLGLNSLINHKLSDRAQLSGGILFSQHTSRNHKVMDDLLGADFWVDVDQFAERDFKDENVAQNDLQNLNKTVKQGESFGYDYNIHVNKADLFLQYDRKGKIIEGYVAGNVSNTIFWREGLMQNGRFPENSLGDSEKNNFFNFGLKGGLTYKITGRHILTTNAAYLNRAPFAQTAYVSPKTRDEIVPGLESTIIQSVDANYFVRYPNFNLRLSGFYSTFKNQTWARSFYHDEYRTFVNFMMTDVDQTNMGIELGAEKTIASVWQINTALTIGDYFYTSRPNALITRDNSQEVIAQNKVIYLKNYKIGGMPQQAATLGLKYNAPKFWYVGANGNYFSEIYLPTNPDRRTSETILGFVDGDPQIAHILDQEKLPNGYTFNIFGGKSWRFSKYNSFLRLNININNILNQTDFITGGFEQLRYDRANIDKFPSKYGYAYGRTYFLMASYIF